MRYWNYVVLFALESTSLVFNVLFYEMRAFSLNSSWPSLSSTNQLENLVMARGIMYLNMHEAYHEFSVLLLCFTTQMKAVYRFFGVEMVTTAFDSVIILLLFPFFEVHVTRRPLSSTCRGAEAIILKPWGSQAGYTKISGYSYRQLVIFKAIF